MLLKNSIKTLLTSLVTLTISNNVYGQLNYGVSAGAGLTAQMSYGLAGSGYWGGTQSCPYKVKTSNAAVSMSDEEKEERQKIKKLESETKLKELERDRAEKKLELLAKKIEKFFEPSVSDFLVQVHMDKMNKCDNYRTFPTNKCPTVGTADASGKETSKDIIAKCDGLDTPPDILKDKWIKEDGSGYCNANSNSSKGSVSSAICSDEKLRPTDASKYRKYSPSECSKALADYRKTKIEYDNAQAKVDRYKEEVEERTEAVADARERAKLEREYKLKNQLEGECEECALYGRDGGYQKPQRDWWSTAANVVGGLGLMWYGKKLDESAQEYNAQLGFPSTSSYGYPFVTAGVYSVINGVAGPGAYGCGGGVGGGGFPYGAGGAWGPYGLNGYGPYAALGGAFGYPSSMYGSPWGGGMYNPGFGAGGMLAGPNGGWPYGLNGQFGLGSPLNGQLGLAANGGLGAGGALCFTWPCNNGGLGLAANGGFAVNGGLGGQIGIPANGGLGFAANGGLGLAVNGGFMNAGGLNNPQYQMQLMQQQQAMLQMQMQQQQQAMQYYQAQAQAQMQAYQRQMQVAQQAAQVQQEIYSLQMRLQMLVSGAYSGSGSIGGIGGIGGGIGGGVGLIGGGAISGGIYFGAATPGYIGGGTIGTGSTATVPGVGTGTRGR